MINVLSSSRDLPVRVIDEQNQVQGCVVEEQGTCNERTDGSRNSSERFLLVVGQRDRVPIAVKLMEECLSTLTPFVL